MITHDAQIICTGTAWVEGFASDETVHEPAAPGTNLQFSRRGLDSSFLMTLHVILLGTTYTEVSAAARAGAPFDLGIRRISSNLPVPGRAAHLCEICPEFCKRLAQVDSQRANSIAQDWYRLQGHPTTRSRPSRVEYRAEVIQNLAAMAQVAAARSVRLLLRVVYEAD
jgi:hypothetical protein